MVELVYGREQRMMSFNILKQLIKEMTDRHKKKTVEKNLIFFSLMDLLLCLVARASGFATLLKKENHSLLFT